VTRPVRRAHVAGTVLATSWIFALPVAAAPLPPQIHTFAGGGSCSGAMTSGGPCDNVSATSVPIDHARSVAALPGGGFLYVDSGDDLVREVWPSGRVTTVAGNGTTTDVNDPGTLAVNSGLNGPVAVAPLPSGGFLITEYNGAVVRMVSPGPPSTATITTIAGTGTEADNGASGQATSVSLNYPTDAEPTSDGRVLVADTNYVRVLSGASADPSATSSPIAGGGSSCDDSANSCDGQAASAVALHEPASISPIQGGASGYLLAEYGTDTIREVSRISTSGTFTTVAGIPGELGYTGDGGPATSALLNHPEQVVSTADGGFLITDTNNEVVRQVSASGTITTVAGNGVATYAGDGGAATSASLQTPAAVAPRADGGFLIADEDNNAIRAVTIPPTTTIMLSPATPNGQNGWYVTPVLAKLSVVNGVSSNCELDPAAPPPVFDAIPPPCAYSGAGADITGDGSHTLYAASINAAADKELPVSVSVKIDTTLPTLTCGPTPSFTIGSRDARVSASVSDSLSGPASPEASAPALTFALGTFGATVYGADQAGNIGEVGCTYIVVPAILKPTPVMRWSFSVQGRYTTVKRLLVTDVPPRAAVNVACTGTGCPFSYAQNVSGKECKGRPCKAKNSKWRVSRHTIDLTQLFAHVQLAPRARLTFSVTEPNTVGRVWLFTIGAHKPPSHRVSCVEPGSTAVGKGCTNAH
jgi:hypothetical protein